MNRMIRALAAAGILALALPALATTPLGYVQVSGSYLQDSTGSLVANATISWAPVTMNGIAISYRVNDRGQAIFSPVTAVVTDGVFTLLLADTTLTSPQNVCFSVTATDNVSGQSLLGPGYTCVQPAGSGVAVTGTGAWCTAATDSVGGACNFDLYQPNLAPLGIVQSGGVGATGPAGPAGATGPAGAGVLAFPTGNTSVGSPLSGSSTGSYNTATGSLTMKLSPSGSYNSAYGGIALQDVTTGNSNAAFGLATLGALTTGSDDSGFGTGVMESVIDGSGDTAIGDNSCSSITSGSDDTCVGVSANVQAASDANETVIGYNAVGNGPNTITFGNSSTTGLYASAVKASSGSACLQTDSSGHITNTGSACGSGAGGGATPVGPIVDALVGSTQNLGNGTGWTVTLLGESRFIVSKTCQVSAFDYDAFSTSVVTGTGPYTFTATTGGVNTHTAGNILTLAGITAGGYTSLNGYQLTITGTPTSTSFSGTVTGVTAGTSGSGSDKCSYSLAQQLSYQPSMSNATIINLSQGGLQASTVAASPGTYIPTVTGANQVIVVELASQDCLSGCSVTAVEGYLQTIWAYARAHGYTKVVGCTLIKTYSSIYSYDSQRNEDEVNSWMVEQAKGGANVAGGGYVDTLANIAPMAPDPYNPDQFMVPGAPGLCVSGPCEADHPQDGTASYLASTIADAARGLTGVFPPIPSTADNSVFSLGDANGDTLTFRAGAPGACVYGYGVNGWSGSFDSPYVIGPMFCLLNPASGEGVLQLNQAEGFASGPVGGGFPEAADIITQRSPTAPSTWVDSANATDAKNGVASGNHKFNTVTAANGIFSSSIVYPGSGNLAYQIHNNRFAGSQLFAAADPGSVPVQIKGSATFTASTWVQTVGNALGSFTVTAGHIALIGCDSNVNYAAGYGLYPPTSALGNPITLLLQQVSPSTSTVEELLFVETITTGGTETLTASHNYACGFNNYITATEYASPGVDGAGVISSFPQASSSLTTGFIYTSQPNDTLVSGILPYYADSLTPVSPFTSRFSVGSEGAISDDVASTAGSYSAAWTVGGGASGAMYLVALGGSPSGGPTANSEEICTYAHVGTGSCADDGSLLAGHTKDGLPFVKPSTVAGYLALTCSTSVNFGATGAVLDALSPAVGSTPVSGGSVFAGVGCNGAGWVVTWK